MSLPVTQINLDVAVIGGGIAGLWTLNRLISEGYNAALFEADALGSDQSIASQGMIHGGMKYTLNGALTGASEAISEMPAHWRACLCGEGDVDLRHTRILSDHFFMWSSETIASRVTTFLASKLTRGRVEPVSEDQRPPLLRNKYFSGSLYRLVDIVLDVPSLVANLALNAAGRLFLIDKSNVLLQTSDQGLITLSIPLEDQTLVINAKRFVFAAGKGNGDLLAQLQLDRPAMQLRPLQQVMVKHQNPYRFYGHCLGAETTPRLTISSHTTAAGEPVWYLGGSLAEKGAALSPEDQIQQAQQEFAELMPWVNLGETQWATLKVDRAEPMQPNFARPDKAFVGVPESVDNLIVAWPTKLTLAPNLANEILNLLRTAGITPEPDPSATATLVEHLSCPPAALTPWDVAFPRAEYVLQVPEDFSDADD